MTASTDDLAENEGVLQDSNSIQSTKKTRSGASDSAPSAGCAIIVELLPHEASHDGEDTSFVSIRLTEKAHHGMESCLDSVKMILLSITYALQSSPVQGPQCHGLKHLPSAGGDVGAGGHTPPHAAHKQEELQANRDGFLHTAGTLGAPSHLPPVLMPGDLPVSAGGEREEPLAELAALQGRGAASSVQLVRGGCAFEALLPAFASGDNMELQAVVQQLHHQLTSSQKELCGHELRISMIVDHMQVTSVPDAVSVILLKVMLGCNGLLKMYYAQSSWQRATRWQLRAPRAPGAPSGVQHTLLMKG